MGSSRTNQAWYLFGTTAQLILSLGLHSRRHSWTTPSENTVIEAECRKRVFWSAYTLDKYFNIILGRPGIFRDQDVDQQLPARVNDSELGTEAGKKRSAWNQCIMDAPVYHIKYVHITHYFQDYLRRSVKVALLTIRRLSRIIHGLCNDLYSIHTISNEDRLAYAEKWTAELRAWKNDLPAFLEPTKVDPSILVPIFQRQSTVLTLAYAHAMILATRQFLLSSFVDLTRPVTNMDEREECHIQECVEAALIAVDTVSGFVEYGMLYRTFWFSQYISFCAIATLYVYTIRRFHAQRTYCGSLGDDSNNVASKRSYTECFEAAEKCRTLIANKTENNSPSRRYSIILDELKRQVLAELEGTSARLNGDSHHKSAVHHVMDVTNEGQSVLVGEQLRFGQNNSQSQAAFVDGQFDYIYSENTGRGHGVTTETSSAMDMPVPADPVLDNEQWGASFDFIGWPELDSWVSKVP